MPIDTSLLERLDAGDKQVERNHINQFIDVLNGMPTAEEFATLVPEVVGDIVTLGLDGIRRVPLPLNAKAIPGVVGDGAHNDTAGIVLAISTAVSLNRELYFPPGTYLTDPFTATGKIRLDPRAVIKLRDNATETSHRKNVVTIAASDTSFTGGLIDANRDGQDISAYNAGGGASVKGWRGASIAGTSGDPITNVTFDTPVINAMDWGILVQYVEDSTITVDVADSGAGCISNTCHRLRFPSVKLKSISGNEAKVYCNLFDFYDCTDITGGAIRSTDQHGYDSVLAGTSLSDWLSGLSWFRAKNIHFESISIETRQDDTCQPSVGWSFFGCENLSVGSARTIGYTDSMIELAGLIDCRFGPHLVDGRWQRSSKNVASEGVGIRNNAFYRGNQSRAIQPCRNVTCTNWTVIRCNGNALHGYNGMGVKFISSRFNSSQRGILMQYQATDASSSFVNQYPQPSVDWSFVDCEAAWNERDGMRIRDAVALSCVGVRFHDNGQAITHPGGTRYSGTTVIESHGVALENSTTPELATLGFTNSDFHWVDCSATDTQGAVIAASTNPATPTVVSVAEPGRLNLGQTVKLVGAGAAGADLFARINEVNLDEVTLDTPVLTFPTVSGTGTLSASGTTITGSGTAFLSQLRFRAWITVAGQTRQVTKVSTDTALVIDAPFSPAISAGSSFTITSTPVTTVKCQKYGVSDASTAVRPRWTGGVITGNTVADVLNQQNMQFVNVDGLQNRLTNSVRTSGLTTTNQNWTAVPLTIGVYRLWFDASGRLMVKGGSNPTSDTDGTIIGTQT